MPSSSTLPDATDSIAKAVTPEPVDIQGFHLVSEDAGWLLFDRYLYWTQDGGQSWNSITPTNLEPYAIRAVSFLDAQSGWLILSATEQANPFVIAQTSDGGKTWESRALSLFAPGDVNANVSAFYFYWLDRQTGWLVTRRATGSNFDTGALFKTTDSGKNWTRLTAPTGDPVYFVTREFGWMAGGPAGEQLHRTMDGGSTWQSQSIPGWGTGQSIQRKFFLPRFANDREGLLPTILAAGTETRVQFYRTQDGGQTWNLETDLAVSPGSAPDIHLPLAVVSPRESVLLLPERKRALRTIDRLSTTLAGSDPWISGIDELDMVTLQVGWANHRSGNCSPLQTNARSTPLIKNTVDCVAQARLLYTNDGGASWQALPLPKID
ncbi:MAG: WD40/YVTN/BNR-like repeat-containing protein, partial [Acidobacteriota bacterium]